MSILLNSPMLQYCTFEKIRKELNKVTNLAFEVNSTINLEDKNFSQEYVRFVQASYRVDFAGKVYYFYFRNKRNNANNSFTIPSSVEVITMDSTPTVCLKKHYLNSGKGDWYLNLTTPEFFDVESMKTAVRTISDKIAKDFVDYLKKNSII